MRAMKYRSKLPWSALAIATACSACGVLASQDQGKAAVVSAFSYVPPQGDEPRANPERALEISESGAVTLAGVEIALSGIGDILQRTRPAEASKVGVIVAKDALISTVAPKLSAISEAGEFQLLNLEEHRRYENPSADSDLMLNEEVFAKPLRETELAVKVGYVVKNDSCVVMLDGVMVGPEELFDSSFEVLDDIVMRSGGSDAVLANKELLESLVARFRVPGDTPWRCVAGAFYYVQAAGWPELQLDVVI